MTLTVWNTNGTYEVLGRHYRDAVQAKAELQQRFGITVEREIIQSSMTTFVLSHSFYTEAELTK